MGHTSCDMGSKTSNTLPTLFQDSSNTLPTHTYCIGHCIGHVPTALHCQWICCSGCWWYWAQCIGLQGGVSLKGTTPIVSRVEEALWVCMEGVYVVVFVCICMYVYACVWI